MQEEITQKTLALCVETGKMTAQLLQQAMKKVLADMEKHKNDPQLRHGKQTIRQLMKHGAGVSNIEITDQNIKAFSDTAKKYGIDFALKKDTTGEIPRYLVFFKGRDADAVTAAFREFSAKNLAKEKKEGILLWCLEGLHRLIGNNYQFTVSSKAKENMETVKRSSNNVIEFLQSEGYIRFRADSEASSKAIYEAYTRWCDDNAQKPMSANRVSSELAQNERLYNVEATNNVHVGGKRVRGFMGIEAVNPLPY